MGNTLREAFFSHEMEEKKTNNMTKEEKTAFEWALNQKFTSVKDKPYNPLNNEILRLNDIIDYLYKDIQEKKLHILKLDSLLNNNKLTNNELNHSPTALLEEVNNDRHALIETINIILKVNSILVDNISILQNELTQIKDLKNERKAG